MGKNTTLHNASWRDCEEIWGAYGIHLSGHKLK